MFLNKNQKLKEFSVGALIISLTNNIIIFWIAAGFLAIGEAINGPTQAVLLTNNVNSKHRGEILGLDAIFDRILNTFSPLIAGILLNYIPNQKILLLFICLFWLAFFNAIFYIKKINNTPS